jgi:hypothetical protein
MDLPHCTLGEAIDLLSDHVQPSSTPSTTSIPEPVLALFAEIAAEVVPSQDDLIREGGDGGDDDEDYGGQIEPDQVEPLPRPPRSRGST